MINALLVDDEENNLNNLAFVLSHDCKDIVVAGTAMNAAEARSFLHNHTVDVIFLDINMPGESGFELLQSLPGYNFKVIFVTAHNEYSLQAIKACALDYVLKPVSIEDIQQAVEKLKEVMKSLQAADLSQQLLKNFLALSNHHELPQRIALPQLGGVTYLDVNEIVSLQADGNYTIIHKRNMQKMVITKTLKDFEEILDEEQFVRIHKSYIVNLQQVKEYSTLDGGIAKMFDGNEWSISRRQLDSFLSKMNHLSLSFKKEH
jgi:two-component system, LytTR family, response regulator